MAGASRMRIRRRNQDPDALDLRRFADDDTRLAAAAERLAAERTDLQAELEQVRHDLALARHLDDGDPDRLAAREAEVAKRLDTIAVELAEIGVTRIEIARRCIQQSRHVVEQGLQDHRSNELGSHVSSATPPRASP